MPLIWYSYGFWLVCCLFTYVRHESDTDEWIEALFATLTFPNALPRERCLRLADDFYRKIGEYTGCHLNPARGSEAQSDNKHEHSIIRIKKSEAERFSSKIESFDSGKAWSFHQLVESFDFTRRIEAYQYALVKHDPVLPDEGKDYFCPKRYHQCRKGNCQHIPAS